MALSDTGDWRALRFGPHALAVPMNTALNYFATIRFMNLSSSRSDIHRNAATILP